MKKLLHIDDHAGELHCDNPRCDYIAPPGLHKFGPHLVGLPCPKCGENLLTKEDYHLHMKILGWVDWINRLGAMFGLGTVAPPAKDDPDAHQVSFRAKQGKIEVDLDR